MKIGYARVSTLEQTWGCNYKLSLSLCYFLLRAPQHPYSMTYLQLITRHFERNDASPNSSPVVEDYLEHASSARRAAVVSANLDEIVKGRRIRELKS